MGRTEADRVIEALEASFTAIERREDEVVADDLAHTFGQGRALQNRLTRGAWDALLADGSRVPIGVVAPDHIATRDGDLLVPFQHATFVAGGGDQAIRSSSGLASVLTAACRAGTWARVDNGNTPLQGRVGTVGADHLELERGGKHYLIPFTAMRSIRLSRGGSADVS